MSINHALMLNSVIELQERDIKRESIKLQELSHWAYRFTSLVSIYNDHTIALEIGRSITLFNGLEVILNLVKHDLSSFKMVTKLGLEKTPKAATIKKLNNCGFKTLNCLQTIPKPELGSRFGKELVTYLDQFWGNIADPQIAVTPPETFHANVDFAEPIRNLNWIQQSAAYRFNSVYSASATGLPEFYLALLP